MSQSLWLFNHAPYRRMFPPPRLALLEVEVGQIASRSPAKDRTLGDAD